MPHTFAIYLKTSFVLLLFILFTVGSFAAVTVTAATGGSGLSADKSKGSSGDSFTALGNIIIASQNNDFTILQSNVTFVLSIPTNWEFKAGAGSVNFAGSTITAASIDVTATTITITYSTNATAAANNTITISGIEVRATSKATIAAANIRRVAGNSTISGFTNTGTANCGTLSQVPGNLSKLQILLPGETAAPGTATGKTGTPTAANAGTAFTATVNAVDENWNRVTTVTHTIGISASDAGAALPANVALSGGNRNYQITLRTPGTHTVTATDVTDGAVTSDVSTSITVNVGPFAKLQLLMPGETAAPSTSTGKTGAPSAQIAGTAFNVTVNAVDAAWNLIQGQTDEVHIASSDVNADLPADAALVNGTGTFSVILKTSGSRTVTASDVTDGTKTASPSPATVVAAANFVKLQVLLPGETTAPGTATGKTGTPTAINAGTAFNVTVNAVDEYWNRVTTVTHVVGTLSTDAGASYTANSALAGGTRNFSTTLRTPGTHTITATDITDGGITAGVSASVTVNIGAFVKLQILMPGETAAPSTPTGKTGTPTTQTAGTAFNVTVNAVDAGWNVIDNVTDVIHIVSSDVNADLPADAALVSGTGTFLVTLKTSGTRSVSASDVTDGTKTLNTSPLTTVSTATFVKLQVLLPGETTAPGTATGKTGTPTAINAGAAFNVTVNAVDEYWNRVTTVTHVVGTLSTDAGASYTANSALAGGTRNFSTTLRTPGTHTITATDITDGGITAGVSASVTVNIGAFVKLQILMPGETAAPSTPTGKTGTPIAQTAGVPFSVSVNAVDAAWNVITSGTDNIGITSSDVNAVLPANAALVAGTRTFSVTLKTSGGRTVTATDITNGLITANIGASTTVNTAAFEKLQVLLPGETAAPGTASGKTGTPTAINAGVSMNVTVNAVDAYWNKVTTVTDLTGITSSDAGAGLPVNAVLAAGTKTNFAVTLRTPGSRTITATDITNGAITAGTSASVTVNVGPFVKLQILVPGETAAPGTATGKIGTPTATTAGSSLSITVNAVDAAWNIITSVTDVVGITSTDANATLPANTALVAGTKSFNVTLKTSGTRTITATDITNGGITLSTSPSITVNVGTFVKLQLILPGETAAPGTATGKTGTPTAQNAGAVLSATINAVDANWNRVTTATDVVGITSSDVNATLPANTALAAGTRALNVTLKTPGSRTITASNITNGSITASVSPAVTVNIGAFVKLQLLLPGETAAPGTTAGKTGTPTARTAGTSFSVTVNAVDAAWNVVTSGTHTVRITTSDVNAALPADAAMVSGTQTFAVTFKTVGTRTVTASDITVPAITANTSPSTTVNAGALVKLQLLLPGETAAAGTVTGKTGTPTAQNAGTAFNVIVNAVDANWNRVTTVTDNVGITSSDGSAVLPANAVLVAGTKNNFSITLKTPGTQTITATDITNGTITANTSPSVTVNIGVFVKLQLLMPGETAAPGTTSGKTGTPTAQVAGTSFNVTVNAVDAAWNLVSSGTHTIRITSNDVNAALPADASLVAGTKTFSVTFKTAISRTVTASDITVGTITANTSPSTTVTPGAFAKLQVLVPGETAAAGTATGKTGTPTAATAGVAFNAIVNAVDANWNRVTTVTDVIAITSSDANATLPANAALVGGTKNNFAVTLRTAGSATITATDISNGGITANASPSITINIGTLSKLQILMPGETAAPGTTTGKTGTPTAATAGTSFNVTVNAVDAAWNVITSTTHTIAITSTDPNAVLPANAALVAGTKTFPVTFKTAGTKRSVTATDVTLGTVTASTSPITDINPGSFTKIQILLPGEASAPGTADGSTGTPGPPARGVSFNIVVNAVDDNFNIVTTATNSMAITSSDGAAVLPATAALVAGTRTFSVRLNTLGTQTLTATGGSFTKSVNVADGSLISNITDHFRSVSSGLWADASTWQSSIDGITNWHVATLVPAATANTVTILNTHIITVAAAAGTDQLTINTGGQLTINTGVVFTVANGTGTDLSVSGILNNAGTVTINASATVSVLSGGKYQHAYTSTAGTIPTITWASGSTCEIIGYTSATGAISNANQTYSTLVWNCPGQNVATGPILGSFTATNFSVLSTGTGSVLLGSTGGTVTISGNYLQSGGSVTINSTSGTLNMNIAGNFTISGGTLTKGTGTSKVNFSGSSSQLFTKTGGTFSGAIDFTVNALAIVDFGTNVLDGSATTFTLASTGTLITAHAQGIAAAGTTAGSIQSLTRTYNTGGNYTYNGSAAQVAGNGLPTTVNNLTINNIDGVTLPATVASYTINGALTITSGTLDMNTNKLLVGASFSNTGSGTLITQYTSTLPIPTGKTWTVGVTYTSNSAQAPVIGTFNNLSFTGTGTKTVASGTVTVNGNWSSGGGKIDLLTNTAAVTFNGTTQSLNDDTDNDNGITFKNVTFSNSGTKTMTTGKYSVSNTGVLTVSGSAVLATNGLLHINSDAIGSGSIAALTGSADITGDVNVQSFFVGGGQSVNRGTRAISSPINNTGLSKKFFEQLKDHMLITGPGNTVNGFDMGGTTASDAVTLQSYNEPAITGSSVYTSIPSITTSAVSGKGYFAYFRGNRSGASAKLNSPFSSPEDVTVTYTGPINKGNVSMALTNSHNVGDNLNGYNLAGNPYPSAINFTTVIANSVHLDNLVVIVKAGGGTASYINGVSNGGGSLIIQPGQAFYCRVNDVFNTGTINFTESAKVNGVAVPRFLSAPGPAPKQEHKLLRVNVTDEESSDETTIVFEGGYSATSVDDLPYLLGGSVRIGSLASDDHTMAINFMPALEAVSELKLSVDADESRDAMLTFTEMAAADGYDVELKDHFLNVSEPVTLNSAYDFHIDHANPLTYGKNRFSLVFTRKPLPVEKATDGAKIVVYPNPVATDLNVSFNTMETDAVLSVYNLAGVKVMQTSVEKGSTVASQNAGSLISGLYVVDLRSATTNEVIGRTKFIKQ